MSKNNTYKFNRFLCSAIVLCLFAVLSAVFIFASNANTLADVVAVDTEKVYVTNDYIFDEPEQLGEYTTYEPEVGDTDISGVSYYCLRDDYVIYTQDQARNGLCWAFASSMALGTTFMLETGEFYDFSEAWIGLARAKQTSSYTFGDGGNATTFNSVIKNYGLVLESDFTYDNSYLVNDVDVNEYYEYYSQFANTSLYDNISTVTYSTSNQTGIKNHIYNNGALSISMYWTSVGYDNCIARSSSGYTYKVPNRGSSGGGHAITAIGWDDTVTVPGASSAGAWICLNSWGDDVSGNDDGVLYVAYSDTDLYGSLYGYKFVADSSGLCFSNKIQEGSGYTNYITNLKGKYYSGYTATASATKQQNIYFDNDIDITYEYSLSSDAQLDSINIFYGAEEVTANFDIAIDTENKTYNLKANDLAYGTYKILIDYSNSSEAGTYVNVIYVNSDAELASLCVVYSSTSSGVSYNGYYMIHNSYNYVDGYDITISTTKSSGSFAIYTTQATYSSISSSSLNIPFSGLSAENLIYTTQQQITGASGNNRTLTINVLFVEDASANKMVNMYYYLNGGTNDSENLNREIISTTAGLTLSEPTRKGYDFAGWWYDSEFTEPVTLNNFGYDNVVAIGESPNCYASSYYTSYLNNSNVAFVYAKWTLKQPTGATLTSTQTTLAYAQSYTLSVESVEHDLGKFMQIVSVDWYLNDSKISTTATGELELVATAYGSFEFYAIIKLQYKEQTVTATSSKLVVVVLDSVSEISYSIGKFSWSEIDSATCYNIKLNKVGGAGEIPTVVATAQQTETSFTLLDKVSSAGNYYLSVSAVVSVDGTDYDSVAITSNPVAVFEVKYTSFDEANPISSQFVDGTTNVNAYSPTARAGYTFSNWYLDNTFETAFVSGSTISQSIELFALWVMNDINLESNVASINREYSGEQSVLEITATHDSGLNNFVYEWKYKQDGESEYQVMQGATTNAISVTNVADSGYYLCTVTLADEDGFSVTNVANVIVVNILKHTTRINTDNIVKEYTYNGNVQKVNSGAVLLDGYGNPVNNIDFSYVIIGEQNEELGISFINVPLGGQYKLKILTAGNENYAGDEEEVYLTVHKATSQIIVTKPWQTYRYTGKAIEPEYTILNGEQTIKQSELPINKGEYDVRLIAEETQNYKQISASVHITVSPANIRVRVNDVTSFLFFEQKELTYTIEGEVYEGDDLNLELHADIDTNKLGSYTISITSDNQNYIIALEYGKYTVTGWPYYIVAVIIAFLAFIIIKTLAKRRYQYEFETNGGGIVSPIDTKNRKELVLDTPIREGYTFVGWYADVELTKPFNKNFVKSKGKTLYAKWQKDADAEQEYTQEALTAQQIVDEIDEIINPKQQTQTEQIEQVEQVEQTVAEPTEQEKLQDLINSVNLAKQTQNVSNAEMEEFIKRVIDINN